MIRKSGHRFSEKIMLNQKPRAPFAAARYFANGMYCWYSFGTDLR
jgi:hypothetical protein